MKPFEVKLVLPVVVPLLEVVRELAEGLKHSHAATPELPGTDVIFRDLWKDELLSGQNEDLSALLELFDDDFLKEGVVTFDQNNAELIIRACSAVRLRLRERYLQVLGDEALETGEVELAKLTEATRKAFMCYLFLATLQELIIQRIEGTLLPPDLH
jgi:hypothetical protein